MCRGVLERIGARRLAARGHDALDDVSVQLELADDGGRKSIPPACSSAKRPAGRLPGAVALAAAVAGCQRASSTGLSPSSGIVGARAAGGGRRGVSVQPGRPPSGTRVSAMTSLRLVIHAAAAALAGSGSTRAGNDGLDNQLGRLVSGLLSADAERVCRLGYRRARLAIRRRGRVGNDLSSTGAPHGPLRLGACSGSTATSPRSRLARSAIPLSSVAASTRWTPRPGLRLSCVAPLASGQSGCLEPLAPTCNAGVTVM